MTTHRCRYRFLDRFHRQVSPLSSPVVLAAFVTLAVLPPRAVALPVGGEVVAGRVNIVVNGTQLTLDQASRAAIMNWQQFNIAPNELVRVLQNGKDAALLARVTGGDPSQLLGRLQADGKVFLVNPKGVVMGQGAIIDTAAFMASTLDVADADFLKGGPLTFKGDSAAGVVNLGRITAREGNVVLVAHTVKNAGEISATHGTAGLGAGTEVYLASPDAPVFVIKTNLPATTEKTGVDNSGVIAAAQAQLEAAGGSIYDLAVNHSGTLSVTGVEQRTDGRIILTAAGGNVSVTGTATARQADGRGGEILMGGDYQGKNSAVANATRAYVGSAAVLDASATAVSGDGGRVIVWADGATRFDGAIAARGGQAGGNGGFAEVSGKQGLTFTGTSDLSAVAGQRGTLLLDPDNITIVAGSTTPPAGIVNGPPVVWSETADPGSHDFGADNLVSLLANNSVNLLAADTITVNAPVVVAAGAAAGAQLNFSASTIAVNQTVSLANVTNGQLAFFHGGSAGGTSLTTAAGATIAASHIRAGGFPITTLNGPVSTAALVFDGFGTQTSFTATNPANDITTFILNTDQADPHTVDFSGNVAVHSGTALSVSAMIGAANNVTFSSAGDLTMRNDGLDHSTITASGTTKLASTGGVLINEVGASLLAGSGRRLLYTSNTGGAFALGGLTGYTQVDGVGYPNDPNSAVTLVLYNAAGGGPVLTLTITATDFIKLYGQVDPTFTASYAGGTAANLTTLPTFSIQQGAHVNVGTYTIVPSGAASDTHALEYVNGTLRIDPATLTYLADPVARLYGDANPALSGTVTGFVNGDTLASATTGALAFTTPVTTASDAGSHAINGGGLTANFGNYVFQDAPANFSAFTVNKAPLTVAFNDATRTYGAANPAFTATYTGLRNGDTPAALDVSSIGTLVTDASPVGTYPIGASVTATNYVITLVPGTLTIAPAPLTLSGTSVTSIYGQTITGLGYSVTGLFGTDTAAVLSGVNIGTAYFNTTPVGTYHYSFQNTGTAQNYVVTTVVPGTLTVTPAPLTLRGNNVTSVYGNPVPALGYTVTGLVGTDTAAVLSGVNVGRVFFNTTAPGTYAYDFANTGTAQNYTVTNVIPGTLTVTRRPVTVVADNIKSLAGAVPPLSGTVTGALSLGGPGFKVQYEAIQKKTQPFGGESLIPVTLSESSDPGIYVLRPVVVPTGSTTAADLLNVYDFTLTEGSLMLYPPPIYLNNSIIVPVGLNLESGDISLIYDSTKFDPNAITQETKDKISQIDFTTTNDVKVKAGTLPLMVSELGQVVRELGPDLLTGIYEAKKNDQLTAEQRALLEKLDGGGLSIEQFAQLVQSDPDARTVMMPLLAKAMMDKLASGQPLTSAQEDLAARMAGFIDDQRQILKQELIKQTKEFQDEKVAAGLNNQYALKTMPDIAKTAQQAATEQAIAAAIGAGAGAGLGVGVVAILNISTVAAAVLPHTFTVVAMEELSKTVAVAATGTSVGAAGTVIAAAVGVVVVGVVSAVMLVQEQDNIKAYDAAMARANTPVDPKLSNLDLKNSDISKAEYFTAFMAAMAEVGFTQPKK